MLNRFTKLLLLCLLLPLSLEAAVSTGIRLNSVGFLPSHAKRASVLGTPSGGFTVRRVADASAAFTGTFTGPATNADTAESLRQADFSGLTETGNFYLDVPGIGTSPNFPIGPDVYNDPFWASVMGFYSHRCGTAVSYTWKGQTFGHGACHMNDAYQDSIGGGHVIRNGTRGWHDAGDYGKYTVNGSFATAMLLQAWEWHSAVLDQWVFPIPESGGAIPDYLDEVKWNLDWLRKMQAANGSAYHKLTTYNFAGFVMPEADTADTQYAPAGSHATADLCGVMAMAARIYQPYDPTFAAQCRATADAAWAWLQANPGEVLPNLAGFGTGAYNETGTDSDHRAFAEAQYWETTGNAAALTAFEARMAADADKVSTFWDWGEYAYGKRGPKNHGIFTYLLSARAGRSAARVADLQADLAAEANAMVATRNAHGYGRPLGAEYHWGSNGTVARQAMLLDAANQLNPTAAYVETALDALGYVYGRNTFARSFVTGVGHNPAMNPHDRHSASDGIVNPVPGHLVGGSEATAGDWVDVQGNFTTNEIAINWDAALVAALAGFCTVPPPATPTPTPSPTPCWSATALRRVNVGGAQQTTGGNTWSADQAYIAGGWGYTGGAVSTNGNAIAGTTDDVLYNTGRYGMTQYQFTVPNGSYRVQVHLAETYFNAAGARVMSMTLEGQPAITALDIYASVGGSTALVITKDVAVTDGILTLGFSATADTPEIRALAIFPTTACPSTPTFTPSPNWTATPTATRTPSFSITPTRTVSPSITPTPTATPTACGNVVVARVNAGGGAFTDGMGGLWAADFGYTGGTAATVANAIAGTTDDTLYQSERYGATLAYAIPVPQAGSYQVRFLWAETYATGAGQRVFSVTLEGAAAVTNLDIFASAGGADRALQLTRTVAVNDGTLSIAATSSVDNAKFDAIEVTYLGPPCSSPTPTFTLGPPSATSTPTATRSASPSSTRTATPSLSASPSATGSSTATSSPSASPTSTATGTPGPGSATVSPTRSGTPTLSATATVTPSPTASSTVTGTGTPSGTPVPGSATPSATRSATPSASRTPSSTPSSSVTLSATRTATASSSPTPTATGTVTLSATASPSETPSFTPVPTGSSATPTPTLSPSFSASPSATPTGTSTVTSTVTPTASSTASRTASPTPSRSPTATLTATTFAMPSPSRTPTVTPSWTPGLPPPPTFTRTRTATPSATATPSRSPSPAPSPTATSTIDVPSPSPTAGSGSGDGPLVVRKVVLGPNPNAGGTVQAWVDLESGADKVLLRVYLPSMVLRGQVELAGSLRSGWNSGPVDLGGLNSGLYYIKAVACRGGEKGKPSPATRMVVLR